MTTLPRTCLVYLARQLGMFNKYCIFTSLGDSGAGDISQLASFITGLSPEDRNVLALINPASTSTTTTSTTTTSTTTTTTTRTTTNTTTTATIAANTTTTTNTRQNKYCFDNGDCLHNRKDNSMCPFSCACFTNCHPLTYQKRW